MPIHMAKFSSQQHGPGLKPWSVRRVCRTRAVQLIEEMALRAPSSIPGTNRSGWRSLSWNGHTGAWWEGTRQWHELKCKRISLEIREKPFPPRTAQQ